MARWKWATAPATASRRWNVSTRRAVAEAQSQCGADGRSRVWREVCDPRYRSCRSRSLPLDRYTVRRAFAGGGGTAAASTLSRTATWGLGSLGHDHGKRGCALRLCGRLAGCPITGGKRLANGSPARLFCRCSTALDYWLTQARLWTVDAVAAQGPRLRLIGSATVMGTVTGSRKRLTVRILG